MIPRRSSGERRSGSGSDAMSPSITPSTRAPRTVVSDRSGLVNVKVSPRSLICSLLEYGRRLSARFIGRPFNDDMTHERGACHTGQAPNYVDRMGKGPCCAATCLRSCTELREGGG